MKNLKIRTRLLLGFGILLLLLIFVSLFSMTRMYYLAEFTTQIYEHPLTVSNAVRDIEINTTRMYRALKDVLLSETQEELEKAAAEIRTLEDTTTDLLELVDKRFLGEKKYVYKLKAQIDEWKTNRDEIISLARNNEKAKAISLSKTAGIHYIESLKEARDYLNDFAGKKALEFLNNAHDKEETAYIVVGIIDAVTVILSVIIAFLLTLSILRPVKIAADVASRLSQGDIAVEIPDYSRDEVGQMLVALKKMAGTLRDQIRDIRDGISVLASSAAEISSAASQFATTTQEVAASVNQVVVSMKEVKQTTELSKEKAKEMADRAKAVVQTSRGGETAVRQTIDVINAIREQMTSIADSVVGLSEKSQFIGDIIAAVDDVADQSRLLAVNASIEAVKAGEQGKGFTVVADEIKNLAAQSKQSTSQVRTILTEIQKATGAAVMATEKGGKAVENGVIQANQTGSAIQVLGESINQTSQSAVQIEATSRQQAAGIDQVFSAVESISAAIGQNADSARQLDTSTRDLNELGKKLKTIVDNYIL